MKTPHAALSLEKFRESPQKEIKNFLKQLDDSAPATFIFLGSEEFIPELEKQLKEWKGVVCACTTCGEIVEGQYLRTHVVGLSFSSERIHCKSLIFELGGEDLNASEEFGKASVEIERFRADMLMNEPKTKFFATLVIDGMAIKEELFLNGFHKYVVDMPFLGGSAADNFEFKRSFIYDGAKFRTNIANVLVFSTSLPFKAFKTQDFDITDKRMVVTESEPGKRKISEIDGIPAADAYAEALGMPVSELNLKVFANNPLIVNYGGRNYIRSVLYTNKKKELAFACAMETGVVVRLGARVGKLVEGLKSELENVDFEIDTSLVFECSLRRHDILNAPESEKEALLDLFKEINAVGFHTYGEQFESVHINQTLTGLLIGHARTE
ncbi:MAG: hypothetical protein CME64_17380 [Halobacteriovoraceae bacterium]|nr:hypothetical protein [Halobacteriovoraceae bacterium]|tara:strand:+ start:313716 stop:314861 length:1146 start_codon:yes stop_codon:yes gene_type:complete